MSEISYMIGAFIGGLLLGAIFFGGLWFTVKKLIASKKPALVVLSSFIFRLSFVLLGFYFIGADDWKKIVSCLVGFIVARFIVIHYTKSIEAKELQLKKEVFNEA